jgi:alpha-mannosidase
MKGKRGNLFKIFEDIPIFWDAWDVEVYHLDKFVECTLHGQVNICEKGPLRASVSLTIQLSDRSMLRQVISLDCTSPALTFNTHVKWDENRKFLKVEFPFDIHSDFATYETAYGCVQRPTHFNTSWDLAKFEVCGHKFADLSEYGYGVALLNDCKYGYSTHGNVMRLSLLRAPKAPDAHCDIGEHTFKYSVYPHKGTFAESSVVQEGLRFNIPMHSHLVPHVDSSMPAHQFFTVSPQNVVLDCVKKSEDGQSLIVRFYEAYGGRGIAQFTCPTIPVKRVQLVNLLEDKMKVLEWLSSSSSCKFDYGPFQIITLKLFL